MAKFELITRDDSDGYECQHVLLLNGEPVFRAHNLNDCPEDAIIGRDLFDGSQAIRLIELGYKLGQANDPIEFTERKATEEDD